LGAAIITSLGALGGFVLGWGATIVVVNIIEARTGLVIASSLEANEFLLALSMAGVGSILAVIGAVAASRKPVADALRS
jgi:ABC-type antimicrobial peptide transport system permease subunit